MEKNVKELKLQQKEAVGEATKAANERIKQLTAELDSLKSDQEGMSCEDLCVYISVLQTRACVVRGVSTLLFLFSYLPATVTVSLLLFHSFTCSVRVHVGRGESRKVRCGRRVVYITSSNEKVGPRKKGVSIPH